MWLKNGEKKGDGSESVSQELSKDGEHQRESFTEPLEYRKKVMSRFVYWGYQCDVDLAVVAGVFCVDDCYCPGVFFVSFLRGDDGDLDGLLSHFRCEACAVFRGDGPVAPRGCLSDLPGEL